MVLFTIPACNKVSNEIYQNVAIEEIINLAQEKKENQFVLFYSMTAQLFFSSYLNNMNKGILTNSDRVIFNIINVALPENKWYTQWLGGADNHVITCVFSSSGGCYLPR